MCEREFYLVRLYIRPGGWRITVLEVMNFDTGGNWSMLAIGWDKKTGCELAISVK